MFLAGLFGSSTAAEVQGNMYADINNGLFVNAKSTSMADAGISLERSANPLGNPANLTLDSVNEAELTYAGFYRNVFSISALSYLGRIDKVSSFGVSMSYLLIPEINISTDSVYVDKMANASELFFRAGYGRKIWQSGNKIMVTAGGALNGLRKNYVDQLGYGIGLDIGSTVLFQKIGLAACAVIENATTSYTHWSADYKEFAYPHARLGIGWYKEIPYIYGRLCASYLSPDLWSNEGLNSFAVDTMSYGDGSSTDQVDFIVPERERISKNPHLVVLGRYGVEYAIMNRLAFRAGLNLANLNFSFGAGLSLLENRAGIDFACLTHELAPTYKLSVKYKWL
jgi:hypothetical protein